MSLRRGFKSANFYLVSLHFRSSFFEFSHELALPVEPLFMGFYGVLRVATPKGDLYIDAF